jgi:inosose dehydratase
MTTPLLERTSAAPISWGICEVPGWGVQLPVDRVLGEMRDLGFTSTELGSAGYLPTDPAELREVLSQYGLSLNGGFVPLALHDATQVDAVRASAIEAADLLAAGGALHFVTCPVSDPNSWDRPELTDAQWQHLYDSLDWLDQVCQERGLRQVVHPHVDCLVETAEEIQRVIDNTGCNFVLETGHFSIGGYDPAQFVELYSDRVGLVHLKDLDRAVAARLNADELTLMQAVQAGLFPSLGSGELPLAKVIADLESAGYNGWYVIEQDVAITDGEPPLGSGPVLGVRQSVEYLRSIESELAN